MPRKIRKTAEANFRGDMDLTKEVTTETKVETNEPDTIPTHYKVGRTTVSMIDPSEWELEDSHEPIALKDGAEVILRIIEVSKAIRPDTGTNYYTVRFEVPSEPFSKDITDWLDEPSRGMDPKRLNTSKQKMMHFMDCFGIDRARPSDPAEDWVGCEGWCILSLRSSEQYGEQNRISKFVRAR